MAMRARTARFKRARGRTSLGAEKWLDTPLHAGTAAAVAALRAAGFRIAAAQVLGSSPHGHVKKTQTSIEGIESVLQWLQHIHRATTNRCRLRLAWQNAARCCPWPLL